MTNEEITEASKDIKEQIAVLHNQHDWLIANKNWLENCPFQINDIVGNPRIIVHTMEGLEEARRFLQQTFGSWVDAHENTFFCYEAIATFESADNPNIAIWLECMPEDFPQELLDSDCQWVKKEAADYELVCSANF